MDLGYDEKKEESVYSLESVNLNSYVIARCIELKDKWDKVKQIYETWFETTSIRFETTSIRSNFNNLSDIPVTC